MHLPWWWLRWYCVLPLALSVAAAGTEDLEDITSALSATISEASAEHEALLHYTQEEEEDERAESHATPIDTSEERTCSRAGLLRAMKKMEARFLRPWELCTGCGGDLLLMFDIRCFEPDSVAPTSTLVQLMPEAIRELLERPGIQEKVAAREQWGEDPAAVCLVGCKSGYRTAASIGSAYLVYECQNITLQHSPDIADETKGELPLFSPSWLPPRPGPGKFSAAEQKELAVLSTAAQPFMQNQWVHRNKGRGSTNEVTKQLGDGTGQSGDNEQPGADGELKGKGKGKGRGRRGRKKAKSSRSLALGVSKRVDNVQMWRCISAGQDLENVNVLHGGMPCSEEKIAGCSKPLFDMGFRTDKSAMSEERSASAIVATSALHKPLPSVSFALLADCFDTPAKYSPLSNESCR